MLKFLVRLFFRDEWAEAEKEAAKRNALNDLAWKEEQERAKAENRKPNPKFQGIRWTVKGY